MGLKYWHHDVVSLNIFLDVSSDETWRKKYSSLQENSAFCVQVALNRQQCCTATQIIKKIIPLSSRRHCLLHMTQLAVKHKHVI